MEIHWLNSIYLLLLQILVFIGSYLILSRTTTLGFHVKVFCYLFLMAVVKICYKNSILLLQPLPSYSPESQLYANSLIGILVVLGCSMIQQHLRYQKVNDLIKKYGFTDDPGTSSVLISIPPSTSCKFTSRL